MLQKLFLIRKRPKTVSMVLSQFNQVVLDLDEIASVQTKNIETENIVIDNAKKKIEVATLEKKHATDVAGRIRDIIGA